MTPYTRARDLHMLASQRAAQAQVAAADGDHAAARSLLRQAYELEMLAVSAVQGQKRAANTVRILLLEAARHALAAGMLEEADLLVRRALASDPPAHVERSLRDIEAQLAARRQS